MKKFIIALSMTATSGIVCLSAMAQSYYMDNFSNALLYCKPYTYTSAPIDILGRKVTDKKRIIGMRKGLCSFVEIVGPPRSKNIIRCNFTKEQINDLVFEMKNYNAGIWSKYYNDESACTIKSPVLNDELKN